MEKYREKGIFALMAVFSDNWPVVFFERQIYAGPKTKREYFFKHLPIMWGCFAWERTGNVKIRIWTCELGRCET